MAFLEDSELCPNSFELISHLRKAKNDIENIVEELKRGSAMNWSIISAILCQLKPCSFSKLWLAIYDELYFAHVSPTDFEDFIFRVLILFDMHKYSDKTVIADVLEILCLTVYNDTPFFMREYGRWMRIRFGKNNGQKYMSTFEKTLVFPYNGIPSLVSSIFESESTHHTWVAILAAWGKVDILKVIISYGAALIVPLRLQGCYKVISNTMDRLFIIYDLEETYEEYLSSLHSIEHNLISILDEKSITRLFFINTVLRCFPHPNDRTINDDRIKCARIIIESTPEPFITSEEIKSVLNKLCSGIVPNEKVLQFVKDFESYLPESREVSTPRTLKHLSRFQVRESLRTARSFPHGVELLDVPKKIQDYICFKDIL